MSAGTALLVSGGVDSAVCVHLLKEQGIDPHLFYIKIGPERESEWNCTSEEDIEICQWLARRYGLPLDIVDLHNEYWEQVVGYFVEKARQGLTPNPDVLCNRLIKFGAFEQAAGKDFACTATGHYARTEVDADGSTWLCTAADAVKDQTDFLCQLTYGQLCKLRFPVGGLLKGEVRSIAAEAGLLNADRRDSQGICFLGDIDFREYAKALLGENPGVVRELETGKRIGEHRGLWFYTIGQRKGLGFGGGPWFVVKKNVRRNILFVSHGYDPEQVYHDRIPFCGLHWLTPPSEEVRSGCIPSESVGGSLAITFKIRHTPEFTPGTLVQRTDGEGEMHWEVQSSKPIHGVAPGQFCVIYDADHHRLLGSGEISV